MTVTYHTTIDDYIAHCRRSLKRSRPYYSCFVRGWFVPPIACLFASIIGLSESGRNFGLLLIAVSAVVYLLIYPFLSRISLDTYFRQCAGEAKTAGVVGEITLLLTHDSFVEVTATTRSEVRWANIHGIEEDKNVTYIYVTSLAVAILPEQGFSSCEEYNRVKDYANECWNKHRA